MNIVWHDFIPWATGHASISTYGARIDFLFDLITYIVGFWFILAEGVLFYFVLRYLRKDGVKAQYITGEKHNELMWLEVPHILIILCDVVLIAGTMMVWYAVKQDLPTPDATVKVIAQQWAWTFVQPGPDGIIDTADDITTIDELHIKANTTYHYKLSAKDVLHSFSIPVFRLKQDAIPGREISGWFKATETGVHDIQCAEICGFGHGLMPARLFIESDEDHKKWMAEKTGIPMSSMVAAIPAAASKN